MAFDPSTAVSLSYAQAAGLAALDRPIHLPSLKYLSPGSAKALAYASQGIVLRNLQSLTVAAAEALAPHKWGLHLTGLVSISCGLGDALAAHHGPLEFGTSLREMHSPLLAKKIAEQSEWQIRLDGLETISPEIARSLAYRGDSSLLTSISLNGLRHLSAEVASELQEAFDCISLRGLADGHCILGEGADPALVGDRYSVGSRLLVGSNISGVVSQDYSVPLMERVIHSLEHSDNGYEHYLQLDALTSLSPKQAAVVAKFGGSGGISLRGLKTLALEAAEALSGYEYDIEFDADISLTPEVKAALSRRRSGSVTFRGR